MPAVVCARYTAVDGQDDRDEMGLCVEPAEYVSGLRRFEQYIFRTQPEGVRSGPGHLDLVVYSLRKWMGLALTGNPTILLPLFVPGTEVVRITELGHELRANAAKIVSRPAGLPADPAAADARRRVELLETGRMTLPIAEPRLTWLRDLRRGKHTQDEAIAAAAELEDRLDQLVRGASPLPEQPDRAWADRWLVWAYNSAWQAA